MGISRDTLNRLEKGDGSIALATYLRALHLLGLETDFDIVAKDDELSRKLQELNLPQRHTSTGTDHERGGGGASDV